ncbi:hypothetical protein L6164_009819 [Bauhinia variegata]|uniref:Uncharacterized protein n=1 Tax=Bauhinia variegata TaxID=167791 RepID=A0ACB9PL65_BAUVA|nr:hypothetical protein L6164_009819 [Bauhinia variegata]
MEVSQRNRDVQDRRLSIIDVSSADDSLIDPISGNSEDHQHPENQEHAELLYTPNSKQFMDAANKLEEWEQAPQPNESLEIDKTKKKSKFNLRKSLAWDSAFFTSAGVLDPEELSSIIEGVEKDEKPALPGIQEDAYKHERHALPGIQEVYIDERHALPGIQEDVYKSCDSISTLESDSLTLESIEADLFEDIRASIQKSSKKSNAPNGNSEVPSEIVKIQTGESLKKVGMASRTKIKMKASLVSKNPNASLQESGKMTKNPISPQVSQKLAARRVESSILRQSKEVGKGSPISTISVKRASLSNRHIRSEKDTEKRITSVSSVSKTSVVCGSRGIVPKPTLSSKSSSDSSVTTKTKSATSTSSGSKASDNISKCHNSLKRKGAGTVKPPTSGSAIRTPSRIASGNKTESANISLSGLMSVTNLSSSVSPASSISDWSSESSSTSIAKLRSSSSRTSLDSSSYRTVSSDVDTSEDSNSQNLPPPPMKPSGLRLPSPKIGYFDGMKSLVRTPRGVLQLHSIVSRGLPKHGTGSVSPSEVQNKVKVGKLQPARSVMSIEDTEPNNQKTSCQIPLHGSSYVNLQNVKNSSEVPVDVENKMLHKTDPGNLKANGTWTGGNVGIHDHDPCSTENYGSLDISMDKEVLNISTDKVSPEDNKRRHLEKAKAALTDGDHDTSFSSATDNVEDTSFRAVEKAPIHCQLDVINDLHPIKGANNQEDHRGDQVDCLSRQFGYMDITLESQKRMHGDSLSFSQDGFSFQENSHALELRRNELLACPNVEESLNGSVTPCSSLSPASFDMTTYTRKPFAPKDSFCNMNGLFSVFTESTVSEVKTSYLPLPERIVKKHN